MLGISKNLAFPFFQLSLHACLPFHHHVNNMLRFTVIRVATAISTNSIQGIIILMAVWKGGMVSANSDILCTTAFKVLRIVDCVKIVIKWYWLVYAFFYT